MKVIVNKTCATVSGAEMLTSGMVGKTIDVEFSADWLGLIKIAVFTNGAVTRDVLDPNGTLIIPWEVLATPNKRASVGFYGYKIENGEKVLAIPTIWAELGAVRAGADPSGDPSAELSPTVAEQLQSDVNDLDERVTEIEEHGGGGGTSDHSQLTNRDASNQHPMSAITGLEKALDSKGTYSKPSGGIPKSDLASAVQTSLGKADSALQAADLNGYATEQYVNNHHDSTKQDVITDLDTIRSGAALGATALQSVPNTYRTAAAQDVIDNGKVDKVTGKGLSTNDYTDADKAKVASAVQPSDLNDYIPKVLGELDGGHTIADNNYIPMAEAPDGDAKKVNVEAFKMYINNGMASQSDLDDYALQTQLITSQIDLSPTDAYEQDYNTQKDVNNHLHSKEAEWDAKLDASDLTDYALKTDLEQLQSKTITDSAGYFTSDTVEGALAEIGAELAGINTLIGSGVIT